MLHRMKDVILYLRSTKRRPPASQRPMVDAFVKRNNLVVVDRFTERRNAKGYPALKKAIEAAKDADASILISNLGNVNRSRGFTSLLRDAPEFLAIDDPDFNSNTIHILAAVAEEVSARISRRMKDAMAALKAKGVKIGAARPGHKGREALLRDKTGPKRAAEARSKRARDYYAPVMPRITELREQGVGYGEIAKALNAEGHTTQTGKQYSDVAVLRIIKRREKELGRPIGKPGKPGRRAL